MLILNKKLRIVYIINLALIIISFVVFYVLTLHTQIVNDRFSNINNIKKSLFLGFNVASALAWNILGIVFLLLNIIMLIKSQKTIFIVISIISFIWIIYSYWVIYTGWLP
jgi:hypothetical protein